MQRIFEALSSAVRRDILSHLAGAELTAGQIAARFDISKPAVSQHLTILENAGLVKSDKRGQYVHYRLAPESLAATLNGFVQLVCPPPAGGAKSGKAGSRAGRAAGLDEPETLPLFG